MDFAELLAAKKPEVTNDVELHIKATIDGTDSIYLAQHNAHWYHYDFQPPTEVTLNGLPWDVAKPGLAFAICIRVGNPGLAEGNRNPAGRPR